MILNIKHKGLRKLHEDGAIKGVEVIYAKKMRRILRALEIAQRPENMDLPGYKLHALTGDMRGMWSVTVSANWRIVFRYDGKDVYDVDLIDYH